MINPKIFRAYDIRGNAEQDLSEEIAFKIGYSFAQKTTASGSIKKIVIGRDGRLTSERLCSKLMSGLTAAGVEIIYIGLVPTPALYFASILLGSDAAIMVTGSHNPKEDNGFKMLKGNKPFFGDMIQELREEIENENWQEIDFNVEPKFEALDISEKYINRITQDIKINPALKVALDPACGAACDFAAKLAGKLKCQIAIINGNIDGNFPAHDPDPTIPKNLEQLKKYVQQNDFDFGIGFDGDGDRIGVVTKSGNILYGDQLLCIYSRQILAKNSGASIIADIKASRVFIDEITSLGGKAIIWKTGHSYIKQKITESGALLAGEMSGHIFFNDRYYGYDDALYAACRLIEIASSSNESLDVIYESLPKYINTPEIRIDIDEKQKFAIVDSIKQYVIEQKMNYTDIDGVRVNTEEGWWLVRASNTGPKIIARAEAVSVEALEIIKKDMKRIFAKFKLNFEL